jgi:hypothetical protein
MSGLPRFDGPDDCRTITSEGLGDDGPQFAGFVGLESALANLAAAGIATC